ncbi:hypothetical protein Tco_0452596 [Tanacetum coccineum]
MLQEPVIRKYVLEFLSTIKIKYHIVELDVNDTVTFQLCGILRRMTMRQFSLALGLYSTDKMNNNLYVIYHENCVRNRPNNYKPTPYVMDISTKNHYETPVSYSTIKNPIRRLVHKLLTLTITGRYSIKEKITLADLFYLRSMDGGELVDVPWHVSKLLCDKAKDDSDEKFKAVEARMAQEEDNGSPKRCPNMSFTNRHRVMDDRLGEIYEHIYKLGGEMEKLTKVMSGMSEQYDEFYGEFRLMRLMQESPQTYFTAPPDLATNLFGLFGDVPSTSHHHVNDMDEE